MRAHRDGQEWPADQLMGCNRYQSQNEPVACQLEATPACLRVGMPPLSSCDAKHLSHQIRGVAPICTTHSWCCLRIRPSARLCPVLSCPVSEAPLAVPESSVLSTLTLPSARPTCGATGEHKTPCAGDHMHCSHPVPSRPVPSRLAPRHVARTAIFPDTLSSRVIKSSFCPSEWVRVPDQFGA